MSELIFALNSEHFYYTINQRQSSETDQSVLGMYRGVILY
jgi:hypothetical protein